MKNWTIYLSGEIHSDWRDQIKEGCLAKNLPVTILGPITNHEASDDCGVKILGEEENLPQEGGRMQSGNEKEV